MKSIGIHSNIYPRNNVWIGYVALPPNLDRGEYVKFCLRTKRIQVRNEYGDNVLAKIGEAALNYIVFPDTPEEVGSNVVCVNVPYQDELIIIDVVSKEEVLDSRDRELVAQLKRVNNDSSGIIEVTPDTIDINSSGPNSQVNISSRTPGDTGEINISTDKYQRFTREEIIKTLQLAISVLEQNNAGSTEINIDYQEMSVDTQSIFLRAVQSIELGDQVQYFAVLGELIQQACTLEQVRLDNLFNAISAAPVTPADGGATFKASLIAAISGFRAASGNFTNILSSKVRLE